MRVARTAALPVLVTVGAVAVLLLWVVHNHGVGTSGGGEAWVATGRVTGLEGTYAALVTVLLLSRVPWLDRLQGMPTLAQWHRWVGNAAIWLLVAHALTIIWGYRAQAHASTWHETRYVVLDLPDMLAATVALGAFVGVGVVSMRAARRRLRYETWQFIHLYLYLALALSFAHQYATGADFATHLDARIVWGAMYAVVLLLLVTFRVVVPVARSARRDLRVAAVVPEADGSTSVVISGRGLLQANARAGQFYIWRFLSRSTWWEAHPFSLSRPPTDQAMRVTVRAAGDFTERVQQLPIGCRVIAEGPFGTFVPATDRGPVLLVAAGAGIAPIRTILEALPCDGSDVTLVYRAHTPAHFALRDEVDAIAGDGNVRVHYIPGAREQCPDLFDAAVLQRLVERPLAEHVSYVCGPEEFTRGVIKALRAAGAPPSRIRSERFRF